VRGGLSGCYGGADTSERIPGGHILLYVFCRQKEDKITLPDAAVGKGDGENTFAWAHENAIRSQVLYDRGSNDQTNLSAVTVLRPFPTKEYLHRDG
jgi:hypothetical protein